MANVEKRLSGNVAGDFFVDSSCIDCDACRQLAPEIFRDAGEVSVVFHQPSNIPETHRALMALVACPTASIGSVVPQDFRAGIFQLRGRFGCGAEWIQRRVYPAQHRDRMKQDAVLRTIDAEDAEHIAFLESAFRKTGRDSPHCVFEFSVSESTARGPID